MNDVTSTPIAEPLAVSIKDAARLIGIGRQGIYDLVGEQKIAAVKSGERTLILFASLSAYVASLPPAKIKAPERKRRAAVAGQ